MLESGYLLFQTWTEAKNCQAYGKYDTRLNLGLFRVEYKILMSPRHESSRVLAEAS